MKPSPPKRPAPKRLVKAMLMPVPRGGAQEGVLLAQQFAALGGQVDGHDLARVGGGEGHPLLAAAAVGKMGHEKGFAGDGALGRRQQLVHQSGLGHGAVAQLSLEGDAVLHPVHRPGLGHHGLARVQLDLHHLHIVAEI